MKRVLIISTGIIATIWASGAFAQTMPTAANGGRYRLILSMLVVAGNRAIRGC
jgi:hypothetical protein